MPDRVAGFIAVPGGSLYYEVAGTGHPLLLIHADVADSRMWDDQFDTLARSYRVIRYDKRGFGRTTSESGSFSYRQDIVDLLDRVGAEKVAVVGLSNGGQLAVDFTLEHPERVDALVVAAGWVSGCDIEPTEAESQLFLQYEDLLSRKEYAALADLAVRVWCDGPGQPEGRAPASVRERVREMVANNYRLHPESLAPQPLNPPAVQRLHEIHVPVLAIAGDLDATDTLAVMKLLAQGVPDGRLEVFPGVAHMVNMEKPEAFAALVAEFLNKTIARERKVIQW
jgi:3-oxoadipate enol-lactonase